jgi:hypothetical protein
MLAVACALVGFIPSAYASDVVEISAPIFPKVLVLYAQEGASFPATPPEEAALVNDASLVFDFLLNDCRTNPAYSGKYDAITLWTEGDPELTIEQITNNYNLVAECSYEQYTAKPYWIPKLVNDIDICGLQLGGDWRLMTQADVESFTEGNYNFMRDTLVGAAEGGTFMGGFYFTLHVYVRGTDGTLMKGDLNPGISERLTAFPADADMRRHYESDLSLRCIRITTGL